jgi:hypothetical protein
MPAPPDVATKPWGQSAADSAAVHLRTERQQKPSDAVGEAIEIPAGRRYGPYGQRRSTECH